MEIKKLFIGNLKRIRKLKGMNQSQLAEKSGFSLGFIGELERGNSWASPEAIQKIANALEVSASALFMSNETLFIEKPISSLINKIISIPDHIYDLAEKVGDDKDIWEAVEGTIEGQLAVRERRNLKKNQA
jgi:transcriptional regulator with XRE-family HTH domain